MTVDTTGRVTAGSNPGYITANQNITVSGDVTGSGTTSMALTLAASGVTAGTYNSSATAVSPITVDAKGRVTAIGTAVTITPAWTSVSGKPTTLSGFGITDALSTSATIDGGSF
jgi:type IV secretory pathway TrbF-like protein